jgi:hypothetical protein
MRKYLYHECAFYVFQLEVGMDTRKTNKVVVPVCKYHQGNTYGRVEVLLIIKGKVVPVLN